MAAYFIFRSLHNSPAEAFEVRIVCSFRIFHNFSIAPQYFLAPKAKKTKAHFQLQNVQNRFFSAFIQHFRGVFPAFFRLQNNNLCYIAVILILITF